MGIENLSSSFVQTMSSGGINDLQSPLPMPRDPSGAMAFFERLAEQMAEIGDSETAQSIVENLNAELIAAASGLPGGNLLPQPGTVNPQSTASIKGLSLDELKRPALESPLTVNQMPVAGQAKTVASGPIPSGASAQDNNFPVTTPIATGDRPDLKASQGLADEIEQSAGKSTENTLSDKLLVTKSEWLNAQLSVRSQSEPEKTPALTLERPVHDSEWKQQLGDRVVWMTRNSMSAAELKVNPPQMGPVEVRINLNNDQMNVLFASPNAAVREAIEAAVPRLREMMGAQQLNLTNVDVSHSFADQRQHHANGGGGGEPNGKAFSNSHIVSEESGSDTIDPNGPLKNHGLLNYYV